MSHSVITAPGSWQTLPKSVLNEWMMLIRKDAQKAVSHTFIFAKTVVMGQPQYRSWKMACSWTQALCVPMPGVRAGLCSANACVRTLSLVLKEPLAGSSNNWNLRAAQQGLMGSCGAG